LKLSPLVYVEPINPDYPLGPLQVTDTPKVEYRIFDLRISEEEYNNIFNNK
jgi:hypothetical protein